MDLKGIILAIFLQFESFKHIYAFEIVKQPSYFIHFSEYTCNKMLEVLKAIEITFQEEVPDHSAGFGRKEGRENQFLDSCTPHS